MYHVPWSPSLNLSSPFLHMLFHATIPVPEDTQCMYWLILPHKLLLRIIWNKTSKICQTLNSASFLQCNTNLSLYWCLNMFVVDLLKGFLFLEHELGEKKKKKSSIYLVLPRVFSASPFFLHFLLTLVTDKAKAFANKVIIENSY